MEIIENIARSNEYITLQDFYPVDKVLLFDIETTGFTPENTMLYLIGCAYYKDGQFTIKQWFNDDGQSENEIICNFMEFTSNFEYIFHYNGNGFDIPYISKKVSQSKLNYNFDKLESIDMYKVLKLYKDLMHVENLKQKSIEKYLGINRLDKYTGGDLIKIYQEYIKKPEVSGRMLLLQHNYEDLEGLLYTTSLLGMDRFAKGDFIVKKMSVRQERLLFSLLPQFNIPKRITLGNNDIIITGYKKEATINVPIVTDTLKFFFDNYKDYYYLPAEDTAMHKSVATYVDRNYREQAKRENCYVKRKGYFVSQLKDGILTGYRRNYNDKESYIELSDSFLQNLENINAYAKHIVCELVK